MEKPVHLTDREQDRLDSILSSARSAHIASLVAAGIALSLSTMGSQKGIEIPIGGVQLSPVPSAIFVYGATVILAAVYQVLMRMAAPYIPLDPRRPPFAWILFASRSVAAPLVLTWGLAPVIAAGLAAVSLLSDRLTGYDVWASATPLGLLLGGYFLYTLPDYVVNYSYMINSKTDTAGRKLSLSVYLHFWMRLVRQTMLTIGFWSAFLTLIPSWQTGARHASVVSLVLAIGIWLLCQIALPFRRFVDRFGSKHGFAEKYSK